MLALIWVGLFAIFLGTDDPNAQAYVAIYTMLAILGTMLLLILQAFVSIAIIVYFRQNHPGEVGIIPGLIAPLIAFVAQVYLVYLLVVNLATFGGSGSFGSNIPYIALAIVIWGFVWGVVLRTTAPEVHAKIGRLVFNEKAAGASNVRGTISAKDVNSGGRRGGGARPCFKWCFLSTRILEKRHVDIDRRPVRHRNWGEQGYRQGNRQGLCPQRRQGARRVPPSR